MKNYKEISYKNSIQKNYFQRNKNIEKKYLHIFKNIRLNLNTHKDVFHSLSDKFSFNFKFKDLERFQKFTTIVIIGMGGSILGSKAIYYFLRKKIKKNFIFLDNIDEDKLKKLKKNKGLKTALFIIISKSGNTIETLSNVKALQIRKYKRQNIIIISERKNNSLYLLSKKMNYFHIEHKNYIGGRYSVLSEVGMVPAYLMGINILRLRQNLLFYLNYKKNRFLKESVIQLSSLLKSNKLKNIILLNYIPQLKDFLYWKQQLIGESLGKKGKGFLPIISSAPKDHHSLLQLYLDGPRDKLFYIFSMNEKNGSRLNQVKQAQKNALLEVLKKKKIPFREFNIQHLSESVLGELFSYFILEIAIVGKLSNINPFDQPAVEQVKINTKKILA